MKATYPLKVFDMRSVAIGLRLGINARRSNFAYRVSHVVGSQSTGEDHWHTRQLDDATTDGPIMSLITQVGPAAATSL